MAVSYLMYNSISLDVETFQRFDQVAIYSEDGADYLYTQFTIIVRSLWHPKAVNSGAFSAPLSMNLLRSSLLAPRKQLLVSAPNSGSTGTSGSIFLKSPLTKPDNVTSYYCDAKLGPQPLFCNIQQIIGEDTMLVDFGITTWVNECPGSGTGAATAVSPVLSHRWAMDHIIGQDQRTRRIIAGTAILRTDLVYDANGKVSLKPDDFRTYLFHNIPPQFRRMTVNVRASSDGSRIDYAIDDLEVDAVIDPYISDIAEVAEITEGSYTETVTAAPGNPLSATRDAISDATELSPGRAISRFGSLFPSRKYVAHIKVLGTRRSTKAGLVTVAMRALAGFRIGNLTLNSTDVGNVVRLFLQNYLVDTKLVVSLIKKEVELTLTYNASGWSSAIHQAAGFMSGASNASIEAASILGAGPLLMRSAADANVTLPPWLASLPGFDAVQGSIDFFRVRSDDPYFAPPMSPFDPHFPDDLPGVTKALGTTRDSYGPRGASELYGGERASRGTTIAHIITAALHGPCDHPPQPFTADDSWNKTANTYNQERS